MDPDTDNAFAELGLSPGATEREVKAAWRRLVSQWHPDRNDSAAAVARMQRINRAFKAIRQGGFGAPATPPSAAAAEEPDRSDANANETSDAPGFDDAGANGTQSDQQDRSNTSERSFRTIHRKLRLTLEEAAAGCTRILRGRITDPCAQCDGAGYRVLGGHCAQCQGSGAIHRASWFGWGIGTPSECEACRGGGIARQSCEACAGSGKAETVDYKVTVRIPAGVRDADRLHVDRRRLESTTRVGELSIRIEVAAHQFLRLDDDGTIRCEMPVDGFAWIGNRCVDMPTLYGVKSVQLDRDRLVYRLKGQGFPIERRGRPGDQLVTITPVFPTVLNADQNILLDQLIASTSGPAAGDERLHRWNQTLRERRRG